MLQDQAYVEHMEGGSAVCGFQHADGTRCGSKLRVVDKTHSQTVGIFTMTCEHTMNKPIAEQHGSTFKTQFWSDGDYALNVSAVTAEFVTGGSETQMNERRSLLKMAKVPSSFYEDRKRRAAEMAEQLGKEDIDSNWEWFKNLPFELRKVQIDMRHASARASKQSTFEVLMAPDKDHGITAKIVCLINVDTDEETGNAWRNEILAVRAFLNKCYAEGVQVHTVAHDSCSKTSTCLVEYNTAMAKKAAQDGFEFTPCRDANDSWHGTKSWKKLWQKIKLLFTKVAYRKSGQHTVKDDAITAKHKLIAARQLKVVEKRIEGLLLQVCNAAKDDPENAIRLMRTTIYNCLIADRHCYCEEQSGEYCACVVAKRMRDDLSKVGDTDEQALDPELLLDDTYNPYLVDERLDRQLDGQSCDSININSGVDEDRAEALNLTAEDLEGVEAEEASIAGEEELEGADAVFMEGCTHDPHQPLMTQITHPIAIAALRAFQDNKHGQSIVRRHCHCVNTSYVESFHNAMLKYCPKRKHFRKTYAARMYLASLDWNENAKREQIITVPQKLKDGTWTKGGNKMLEPKTFNFQQKILEAAHTKIYWATPEGSIGSDYSIVEGRKRNADYDAEHEEHSIHNEAVDREALRRKYNHNDMINKSN